MLFTKKYLHRKINYYNDLLFSGNKYDEIDSKGMNYALFLLNKKNNYRTNFSSSYYSNFPAIIRNISLSLPHTHNLFVKNHPNSRFKFPDNAIMSECKQLSNVYLIDPMLDTYDLIESADLIFTIASMTGLEALFLLKHVITFGENPYFFGKTNAPVMRMNNWDELPKMIRHCIDNPPNKTEILTYLYSFYQISRPVKGLFECDDWSDYDISESSTEELYRNAGTFLGQMLKNHS